jgi:hypothetical protein
MWETDDATRLEVHETKHSPVTQLSRGLDKMLL